MPADGSSGTYCRSAAEVAQWTDRGSVTSKGRRRPVEEIANARLGDKVEHRPEGREPSREDRRLLVVHGTKKFLERVGPPSVPADTPSTTQLGSWYATVLVWRPQVALFVNVETLTTACLARSSTPSFHNSVGSSWRGRTTGVSSAA